jgi:predicted Fe-Mo cluster-binding NifX family protein
MRTKGIQTMKIAVTYDNGEVFQHFGKTENFKVYEVEDNKIISSEVISSNGSGHGALAGVLADQGVDFNLRRSWRWSADRSCRSRN